ncbi:MAG: hypothetical protein ACFCU1_08260, partial [Sumerlaeia bacterium]
IILKGFDFPHYLQSLPEAMVLSENKLLIITLQISVSTIAAYITILLFEILYLYNKYEKTKD